MPAENNAGLTEEQVKAAKEAADAQMKALIEAEEATKVLAIQTSRFLTPPYLPLSAV